MTRKQLNKWWKEIEAFKNGKEIEIRQSGMEWIINTNPMFANDFEYRIKPEPEFIPFDYSDAEFLIGKAVKSKNLNFVNLICKVGGDGGFVIVGNSSYTFQQLYDAFIFIDGAACGKIKQK